jgi:dipeptidyl aminopeptidase/acylaminoacyl peptidase
MSSPSSIHPPPPLRILSPTRDALLQIEIQPYPSIEVVAQPILRLAGVRINPQIGGLQRTIHFTGLSIQPLDGSPARPVILPQGSSVHRPEWSHDGKKIAFARDVDDGIELWIADAATGQSKRIDHVRLNDVLGNPITWMSDNRRILAVLVPEVRGPAPSVPRAPAGPQNRGLGHKRPAHRDDNLVPLVESVVRDGKLILRIKDNSNIRAKLPLLAEALTDLLDQVTASGASTVKVSGGSKVDRFTAEASGAAQVSVDGLRTPRAIATATGASQVVLSGSAESLKVDAAGASQVKAEGLKVGDADVSKSGASGVDLRASKSVAGDVSGASRLALHGRPPKKNVSTSGAASVNDKE